MKFPLFDAHADTLSAMHRTNQPLWSNRLHVDLKRGQKYAPRAQFFVLEAYPGFACDKDCFAIQYQAFQTALEENPDHIAHCRTASDAEKAEQEGKTAAFLSVEGAEILQCSIDRLQAAYKLGVRMVGLTWNKANDIAGTHIENATQGLTEQGRKFVKACQALGVIVDVSHLSEPGFWDVSEEMEGPFVASHSNARALCPQSRNLTDKQFVAIMRSGGVAGINLFRLFLGGEADMDRVVAHMEHFLALGGKKSIAIGADFDGCDKLPAGISGVEDMEKLAERMLQRNHSEEMVKDIFYHNLMRVVDEVCGI